MWHVYVVALELLQGIFDGAGLSGCNVMHNVTTFAIENFVS